MPTDAPQSAVEHARALEEHDARVAAELATVVGLAERVGSIRARASEAETAIERQPREQEELVIRRAAAESELTALGAELEQAEQALARLTSSRRPRGEELDRARSKAATAREAVVDVEAQLGRLAERETALREQHATLEATAAGLVRDAAAVTDEVDRVERITSGSRRAAASSLAELDAWAGQARSALFVARGTLETERERIVQEANALGSLVLGEPLGASSVALVRRRLEEHA